jgi:hypothetical protein
MSENWWIGVTAFFGVLLMLGLVYMSVARLSRRAEVRTLYWRILAVGLALTLVTMFIRHQAVQTVLGLLGGMALWSALAELGPQVDIGQSVNSKNWSLLLIVGLLVVLGVGAPFPPVTGLRNLLGLPAELLVADASWGVITAVQFFLLTWLGHVALVTAYYHPWFGVRSWLTWLLLGASLVGSVILVPQMVRQTDLAEAIRWAIWAVIVVWTVVEILKKWGMLSRLWGRRDDERPG